MKDAIYQIERQHYIIEYISLTLDKSNFLIITLTPTHNSFFLFRFTYVSFHDNTRLLHILQPKILQ